VPFEHRAQLPHLLGPVPPRPLGLDVVEDREAGPLRLLSPLGQAQDPRAAVGRVGHALEIAETLEVGRCLAHGLLGDPRGRRELGQTDPSLPMQPKTVPCGRRMSGYPASARRSCSSPLMSRRA
jgi:hypothetical protein